MRRGFTLIEMVTTMTVISIMLAISVPVLRVSPVQQTRSAAIQLARDLELMRTRSLAAKKRVQLVFDDTKGAYVAYLDDDGNGVFNRSSAESRALGMSERRLPSNVIYGRGPSTLVPGDSSSAVITFTNKQVEFDTQGLTTPFGTRGTVYLRHRDHADVNAAVSVSGAGSFRVWIFKDGAWQ